MANEKEPTVEVELLADAIRLGGVDYSKGDVITLPKSHAERLQKFGSVGPKGTLEQRRKAEQDRAEADARYQRHLKGLGELEEVVEQPRPGPGRPRKTAS